MRGKGSSHRPGSGGDASAVGGRPLLIIIAAVLSVALVVAVTTLLVLRDDEGATPSGPGAPATPATSDSATTSPTPRTSPSPTQQTSPSPTEEPTQDQPSAAEALDRFFVAAGRLDQQLQTAATAINATGPPWEEISADVARKVQAADLEPVSRAVPAGLPHDLQESVILVLSDLASRRMAMESFTYVGPVYPDDSDIAHLTNEQLLAELGNGHAAAVRFDSDLAAARELAAASAPIASVPTQSRLTAEVLVLVEYVRVANAGCDARGGAVFPELPQVIWRSVADLPDAEGTVDGIAFNADLRPNGTWQVYLFAC